MDVRIKTALISVSDKSDVVDFAKKLSEMGVKIISTGGNVTLVATGAIEPEAVFAAAGRCCCPAMTTAPRRHFVPLSPPTRAGG